MGPRATASRRSAMPPWASLARGVYLPMLERDVLRSGVVTDNAAIQQRFYAPDDRRGGETAPGSLAVGRAVVRGVDSYVRNVSSPRPIEPSSFAARRAAWP